MEKEIGYMSDTELETKLNEFTNHQPGSMFMNYFFTMKEVVELYNEYAIAVEDNEEEKEISLKKQIIAIIDAYYLE